MSCINTNSKIEFYLGDSLDIKFTVKYDDNSPVDLASFFVRFKVRETSILKTSEDPDDISIESAVDGIAVVHLKPADTVNLIRGFKYTYDAEIYDATNIYTFSEGLFRVI